MIFFFTFAFALHWFLLCCWDVELVWLLDLLVKTWKKKLEETWKMQLHLEISLVSVVLTWNAMKWRRFCYETWILNTDQLLFDDGWIETANEDQFIISNLRLNFFFFPILRKCQKIVKERSHRFSFLFQLCKSRIHRFPRSSTPQVLKTWKKWSALNTKLFLMCYFIVNITTSSL